MNGYTTKAIEEMEAIHHGGAVMSSAITEQASAAPTPKVVTPGGEALWFLGTVACIKLDGEQTGGRFALWEGVFPRGAAPPLHSHPQDETFYVIEGELTVWIVEPELAEDPSWVKTRARHCGVGAVVFAPAGVPHTFRVETDTARALLLSTPAGIENYVRALGEPARWPWLQPPADGPRIAADRMAAVEQRLGMVRHGPPPPPVSAI